MNETDQRPIDHALVRLGAERSHTDSGGRFELSVPVGTATLIVTAPGYFESTTSVVVPSEGLELAISLFPTTGFEESVDVVSESQPGLRPARLDIRPESVERVAGSLDNIFRTLKTIPGIAGTEDFSSRLAVRGGTPDQNLTFMDGVEIHNPYRLFGITSAFNPEAIESFELTAGGFSVLYGDRLSSILVVENRVGGRALRGAGALSLTDGNIVVEGALPGPGGSFLVTGRRTYYDLFAERFVDENLPSFGDLQAKAHWEFGDGHRLNLTALRSREGSNFELSGSGTNDRGALNSDAGNDLVSMSFEAVVGSWGSSRSILSWYRNTDFLDFDGNFRQEARRSNSPEDPVAFGRASVIFDRELAIRDRSFRQELSASVSETHFLQTGFEFHLLSTRVDFSTSGDRSLQEANGSSQRGGIGLPDRLSSGLSGSRGGIWIQDSINLGERLTLQPGARVDWSRSSRATSFSPRVAASYRLDDRTRLTAAAGLYTQSPGYEKLISSDYFIDLSTASSELDYEQARHLIVGVERQIGAGLTFRAEGYYKRFDDLIVGGLETPEALAARRALYDFPAELADSVPTNPIITSTASSDAGGNAYGLDLLLQRRAGRADTRLTGWLTYSLGKATRRAYGLEYPFEYDRRHAMNLVGSFRLSKSWQVALTARLATGFPRTPVDRLVNSAVDDGSGRLVPERDAVGELVYAIDYGGVENLNSARLPFYSRLDLRGSYQRGGPQGRWELYVEVINLLNRDNASFINPNLAFDPMSQLPRLVEERDGAFPLLPTFGFRIRF